jgi:hypothetical protein
MYLDVAGLVTTGLGNLLGTPAAALQFSWRKPDGSTASSAEVTAEWQKVHGLQSMRKGGGGAFQSVTTLRCTDASIDAVINLRLNQNEEQLVKAFSDWENWCADAQLATLSMSWAMGAFWPGKWPHFCQAANAGSWGAIVAPDPSTGRAMGQMNDAGQNASFRDRNAANLVMFGNSAVVAERGMDVTPVYYPRVLAQEDAPDDPGPPPADVS